MGYIKQGKTYPDLDKQLQDLQSFLSEESQTEEDFFVEYSMAIAYEVDKELKAHGLTQKDLAAMMNKRESEISKWLSGLHNLTLRSIAKMSAALGKKIIFTYSEAQEKFSPSRGKAKVLQLHATKNQERPIIKYPNESKQTGKISFKLQKTAYGT